LVRRIVSFNFKTNRIMLVFVYIKRVLSK